MRLLAVLGFVGSAPAAAMQGSATFNGSKLAGALGILTFQTPSVVAENEGSAAAGAEGRAQARRRRPARHGKGHKQNEPRSEPTAEAFGRRSRCT